MPNPVNSDTFHPPSPPLLTLSNSANSLAHRHGWKRDSFKVAGTLHLHNLYPPFQNVTTHPCSYYIFIFCWTLLLFSCPFYETFWFYVNFNYLCVYLFLCIHLWNMSKAYKIARGTSQFQLAKNRLLHRYTIKWIITSLFYGQFCPSPISTIPFRPGMGNFDGAGGHK